MFELQQLGGQHDQPEIQNLGTASASVDRINTMINRRSMFYAPEISAQLQLELIVSKRSSIAIADTLGRFSPSPLRRGILHADSMCESNIKAFRDFPKKSLPNPKYIFGFDLCNIRNIMKI
jgi:hypothetical protein